MSPCSKEVQQIREGKIHVEMALSGSSCRALPVELTHIQAAAARLQRAQVPRTPVLRSDWVDAQVGARVHFKVCK